MLQGVRAWRRAPWTLIWSLAVMAVFIYLGVRDSGQLSAVANSLLEFTTRHFGWLYLFVTTGFLLFCLGVVLGAFRGHFHRADFSRPYRAGVRVRCHRPPVLLSMLWFATLGASALYFEMFEGTGLGAAVETEIGSTLFLTLDCLPLAH